MFRILSVLLVLAVVLALVPSADACNQVQAVQVLPVQAFTTFVPVQSVVVSPLVVSPVVVQPVVIQKIVVKQKRGPGPIQRLAQRVLGLR